MMLSIHSIHPLSLLSFIFCLLLTVDANTQNSVQQQQRVYVKIEVKGLACPYCAFGMEKELKKLSGVDLVEIELKTGMAYISMPPEQKPTEENLRKIITDAGFTAGEIEFSDQPYVKEEKTPDKL